MISFPILFINLLSIVMMLIVTITIWNIRDKNGAMQLFVASLFMLLWSIGSFSDLISADMRAKLIWRNFTQIGVFFTPVASLLFAIVYTGIGNSKRKLIAYVSYTFQSIGVLLVWTDGYHHLIRESVTVLKTPLAESLVVVPTMLAKFLISFNVLFSVIALVFLGVYALVITTISRKQNLAVFGGMLVGTLYSLLKVVMGDSFAHLVPISGIFAISALFMLLGIYRYDLLKIAPLAREQVFHFLGDGIVIASSQGKILEANQAALSMMGPTLPDLGTNLVSEIPKWHEALVQAREGEFSFYRSDTYYVCSVYAIRTSHGSVLGTISLLKDNTEQKRKNDLLLFRAERDGLTGIYNRQTFIEKVEKRLDRKGPLSTLAFFDIDHFKRINDKYGHMAGDQMLQAVSTCAYKAMVGSDLMGRMGGEEFAIYHTSENQEEALAWAENLRQRVEDTVITIEKNSVSCTISLGLCFSTSANFDEMYRCADKEVYKAKDAGRNCVRHTGLD
ncbi:MAG TPA: diguanylate cyclase [Sphaerochaeta sp.]|nr:diguanylate cyclase [Sphaerochaeta sp.]